MDIIRKHKKAAACIVITIAICACLFAERSAWHNLAVISNIVKTENNAVQTDSELKQHTLHLMMVPVNLQKVILIY